MAISIITPTAKAPDQAVIAIEETTTVERQYSIYKLNKDIEYLQANLIGLNEQLISLQEQIVNTNAQIQAKQDIIGIINSKIQDGSITIEK